MEVKRAEFVSSYADVRKCPEPLKPEFAFIGRSNVGKSSLINMLVMHKGLAKVSSTPGKTQTINHFIINDSWYLVDLPGYGYARLSKSVKQGFGKMIEDYVKKRSNLFCLFILIDCRLEPQPIDMDFINWAGALSIPIALIFTKTDKLSANVLQKNIAQFQRTLRQTWEELPTMFVTSATERRGRQELLDFISKALSDSKQK